MAFIDPATLRKYPGIAVVLGLATAAFVWTLVQSGREELDLLLEQRAPGSESIQQAVTRGGVRWVTVSGGRWECDRAVALERTGVVARAVFGRVESLEVPIYGETEGHLLVGRFKGGTSCEERSRSTLTGVIGSVEVFTSRGALARWRPSADRVAVLNAGASPSGALRLFALTAAVGLGGLAFAGYYLKLLLKRESGTDPHSLNHPIEPS